jgi:hypothetical protein
MKYAIAIAIIVVCILVIANIDKLKAEAPKPSQQYVNSTNCAEVELDTTEDSIFKGLGTVVSGIFSGIAGTFGLGSIVNPILGNATGQLNEQWNGTCIGILHNEISDQRSSFNYEKIVVVLISIVLLIVLFKK